MLKKILEKLQILLVFAFVSLGAIELYYVDFLFFGQPLDFTLKYLHIPSLILAYLFIHFMYLVDEKTEKPKSPTRKQEFWIMLVCFSLIFYFSTSFGLVSMYNRLIGKQENVVLKVEFLENKEKLYRFKPNNVNVKLEDGNKYLLFYAIEFAKNIKKGEIIELEMKKGSLGFYYNN